MRLKIAVSAVRSRPQPPRFGMRLPTTETFRGLKSHDFRSFGEYRPRRLVLEAWDIQLNR